MAYLHCRTRTRIPIRVSISIPKMDTVVIGDPSLDRDQNLSLCNVNMFPIVQCRYWVANPNQCRYLNLCPAMWISSEWDIMLRSQKLNDCSILTFSRRSSSAVIGWARLVSVDSGFITVTWSPFWCSLHNQLILPVGKWHLKCLTYWTFTDAFESIKDHLHWAKANFFLWSLSLLNTNIKLYSLWTHLEVMSLLLSLSL